MNIAVIATSGIYPLHIGGPANIGYFLARELGRLGHITSFFVRTKNQAEMQMIDIISELKMQNVKIIPITIDYNNFYELLSISTVYKMFEFAQRFNKEKIDIVVYVSLPIDITLLFPIVSKIKKTKQIFLFLGYGGIYKSGYGQNSTVIKLFHLINKILIMLQEKLIDKSVVESVLTKKIPLSFGFKENKIEIIPSGIDLEPFDNVIPLELEGSPKILYIGRLIKIKGIYTLVKAFSIFMRKFPNARLYIVGDGPEKYNLEQFSMSLGAYNNVQFEGFVQRNQLIRYYKSCELQIIPSYLDAVPLTLLEGIASKIPIITTLESTSPELTKCGIIIPFFPKGDWKILAIEMEKIFINKNMAKEICLSNYLLMKQNFSIEKVTNRYLSIFEKLL